MFLAVVVLPYSWKKTVLELFDADPARYRELRSRVRTVSLPHTREELEKMSEFNGREGNISDQDEIEAWNSVGIAVEVSRVRGLASNSSDLHKTIYQISVANVGLMQIQRVEVLEDVCTWDLQAWLDKGWRILAVCPPNDARRPSYVVGHFEKEA